MPGRPVYPYRPACRCRRSRWDRRACRRDCRRRSRQRPISPPSRYRQSPSPSSRVRPWQAARRGAAWGGSLFESLRSCFGMRLVVNCHEVRKRYLSVLLRGGETGVAQKFLYGAQVGAVGEQVGGVGVAEAVRMQGGVAGEIRGVQLDDAGDSARGEARVAVVEEDRAFLAHDGTFAKIAFQRLGGLTGKRYLSLLFSFAADA